MKFSRPGHKVFVWTPFSSFFKGMYFWCVNAIFFNFQFWIKNNVFIPKFYSFFLLTLVVSTTFYKHVIRTSHCKIKSCTWIISFCKRIMKNKLFTQQNLSFFAFRILRYEEKHRTLFMTWNKKINANHATVTYFLRPTPINRPVNK